MARSRVVFDIETIGCDWTSLSDAERAYLTEKAKDDDPSAKERAARESLALSPLTGELVLIGMLNPDSCKGKVHVRWPPSHPLELPTLPVNPTVVAATFGDLGAAASTGTTSCGVMVWPDETSLLRAFWEDLTHYDQLISFNGRCFDGPFLMVRSLSLGVPVGRNLVPNRYHDAHLDLMDRLSCYGAMRDRYTLDFWCRRLGISSPKDGGMSGRDVERVWRAGELSKLCAYNAVGDLRATAALLQKYTLLFSPSRREGE